jgi:3-methyladenine DNA glycosylase AlkD
MEKLRLRLRSKANSEKAKVLQKFFNTGVGEYGEGDIFIGVSVPDIREIAKSCSSCLSFLDIQKLLNSKIHEEKLCALLILVEKYQQGDSPEKERVFKFYKANTKRINNWDLVDLSAPKIVGDYLLDRDKDILYSGADSDNLWERRIAVVSCFEFIRQRNFEDILKIAEILIPDDQDLIHKAVGWMLREVGKRDFNAENIFLKNNYKLMPRTMLRYAIERFPETLRKSYLNGDA